jgi:hypothetical protein
VSCSFKELVSLGHWALARCSKRPILSQT